MSKFLSDQSESFLGLLEVEFTKKGMHGLINHSRKIKINLKSLSSVDPFLQKWHLKRDSSSLYPFSKKLENESLKPIQTIQF